MSKPAVIEEFVNSYDKFEKKVKMRVLISLLGLEYSKKVECTKPILKLLELASYDSSDQVSTIIHNIIK